MPRKAIEDLISELHSWLPSYPHGETDYPTLLWRILASAPGGDQAEDMGYEPFNLSWQEIDQLGRVLVTIQDNRDVGDLIQGLLDEDPSSRGVVTITVTNRTEEIAAQAVVDSLIGDINFGGREYEIVRGDFLSVDGIDEINGSILLNEIGSAIDRAAGRMEAPREKPFHVYGDNGFESAHSTESAALRAAKSASARNRSFTYQVIKATRGHTGGGSGIVLVRFRAGRRID